jgi:hypothetical protein
VPRLQPADDLGEQQVLPDIAKVREMRVRHAGPAFSITTGTGSL